MMQATCLLWLLSLFNKLSDRRYVFAFSLNQKSAFKNLHLFSRFFCQNRPSNTQNAIIPQYSTTNIFMEITGAMRIMRIMGIMGTMGTTEVMGIMETTGAMGKRQRGSASSKSDVYAEK